MVVDNCKLHYYQDNLAALEHSSSAKHDNLLVFVGGLGDSIGSVPYVAPLAAALDPLQYTVVELEIQSSRQGYGTGSLDRDGEDIKRALEYFRGLFHGKIVYMGHSTGTQDGIHYLLNYSPKFDGVILQAPVSDREGCISFFGQESVDDLVQVVKRDYIDQGKPDEYLSRYLHEFSQKPITASRTMALLAERGADDYFSSYLTDDEFKQTFGKVDQPLLICYSGADECAQDIDKNALVNRWQSITPREFWSLHGGIIPGATHNVGPESGDAALPDLIHRVTSFVKEL